jgi:hypothetical protein
MADSGEVRGAAALVPRMVAVAHLVGEGLDARVITLQAAMDSLDDVPGADRERARLRSAMAAAFLMDDRLDEAIEHGERSRAENQRIGDDEAALNTEATLGSVFVLAGRMDEGWRLLEGAVARATSMEQEAEAARGYRMIGSSASVLVEYDRAEWWLAEGAGYAGQVELWNHRHYMAAHLAHVQWATGQWDAAARMAEQVLADGRGGITTRITALYVLGYLAMGRGDWDAAAGLLGEALAAGEQMGELRGCRRRCGGWPMPRAARVTTIPPCCCASGGTPPRPMSPTPRTCSRTCSPACGRTWPAAMLTPPRPGHTGPGKCWPSAPFPARCPRSATRKG